MTEQIQNPKLVLTATQVQELREHLIREDELERIAVLYCSRSGMNRYLTEEIVPISDDELIAQSGTRCRPTLEREREFIRECSQRDMHIVVVHSHPFDTTANPWFSPFDRDMMEGISRMSTGLYPEMTVMFGVFSEEGVIAAIHNPELEERELLPATVIGNGKLETPLELSNRYRYDEGSEYSDTDINTHRYDRSILAFGEAGQKRLADTHIGLVGLGGLGSIMAQQFARDGIGRLTLIDPDVVEEHNLPRLFGAYDYHINRPKVEAIKEQIYRDNPDIEVTVIQDRVENAEDALKDVDLIVAGVDKASTRIWLNVFAVKHLVPYVDAGVVIKLADDPALEPQTGEAHNDEDAGEEEAGDEKEETEEDADEAGDEEDRRISTMEGYIQFIQPGVTGCMECIDRTNHEQAYIDELSEDELEEQVERGYIDETELSPVPAVAPLNGQIAAKTVQLVAKHIIGYAPPEDFLRIETVDNTVNQLTTRPRAGCPICGELGILGRGDRDVTDADLEAISDQLQDRDAHIDLEWEREQLEQNETEREVDEETDGEDEDEPLAMSNDDRYAAFYDTDTDTDTAAD